MYHSTHSLGAARRPAFPQKRELVALTLVGVLSLFAGSASAQFHVNKKDKTKGPYPQEKIGKIAKEVRADGRIIFKDELKEKPGEIVSKYKEALGLGDMDELRATETQTDELNNTRYRYTQYHAGLPVEGGDFSVYGKADRALRAHGRLVQVLGAAQRPILTEREALAVALTNAPAKLYEWQDEYREQQLRIEKRDSTATHFPKGQLLYALTTNDGNAPEAAHRLAYRFNILRLEPEAYEAVYVDALTGRLLRIMSLVNHSSCQANVIDTWYNGVNQLSTWWESSRNRYQLKDYCRGSYILTRSGNGSGRNDYYGSNSFFLEAGGSEAAPLSTNWNWDFLAKSSASAHFSLQAAHYYFKTRFNRNGAFGNGRELRVIVNNFDGAEYFQHDNNDNIAVGRLYNTARVAGNSFAELDVMAHEFTHGVVAGSARLGAAGSGEPGALNESFADIFGEMSELAHTGQHDWALGRGVGFVRAFAQVMPSSGAAPAQFYLSQARGWSPIGLVHQNSGVQSRWFYLLSVGGTSVDNGVVVNAIGEDKAARIAYRNLTWELGEFSNYANARAGSIEAAIYLYGACSPEVTATINAWAAVGVGDRAPAICAAEITGFSQFCAENGPSVFAEYRVQASPGALKDWSSSNGAFGFGPLGRVDFVTLYQIPSYADATTLSVYIQSPTNPAANTWRYYTINTIVCSSPPNCPPGQICEVQAQQVSQQAKTGSKTASNLTSQGISIYPNPATIAATLDLGEPATGPTMVSLKDMLGRTVYSHLVTPGQQTLPLALHHLPNGTFILSVTTTQGSTSQRLLINR